MTKDQQRQQEHKKIIDYWKSKEGIWVILTKCSHNIPFSKPCKKCQKETPKWLKERFN